MSADTGSPSDDLKRMTEIAEQHAYSVRQLIGQRARLQEMLKALGGMGLFPNKTSMRDVAAAISESKAQFFQDIYPLLFAQGKRGGFFVEFGACDGVIMSNTLLLEQKFGWTGILAEPSRHWQAALKANRKARIETRCVAAKTGQMIEFTEADQDHTQSTTSDHVAPANSAGKQYKVPTISLLDMLVEHKAPKFIDFMSVDTEGSEFDILKAFPFKKYKFGFITVEHHAEDVEKSIKNLMAANGYKQVFRAASGHDGFYVPGN